MPAPTLAALYAFEKQIMAAASGVLAANGYPSALTRSASDPLPDTVTVVKFTTLVATGEVLRVMAGNAKGRPTLGRYNGELEVTRYRPRAPENSLTTIQAQHNALAEDAGAIRPLFLRDNLPFTDANLPYLRVTEILPLATAWGFDPEQQLDMLTLRWQLSFEIQSTAWPT